MIFVFLFVPPIFDISILKIILEIILGATMFEKIKNSFKNWFIKIESRNGAYVAGRDIIMTNPNKPDLNIYECILKLESFKSDVEKFKTGKLDRNDIFKNCREIEILLDNVKIDTQNFKSFEQSMKGTIFGNDMVAYIDTYNIHGIISDIDEAISAYNGMKYK